MTTYFKATFSNGRIELRSTKSGRAYTHCYLTNTNKGSVGFSSSHALADKAMRSWRSYDATGEVVPAVEISAKEYRSIKQAERDAAEELAGINSVADRI